MKPPSGDDNANAARLAEKLEYLAKVSTEVHIDLKALATKVQAIELHLARAEAKREGSNYDRRMEAFHSKAVGHDERLTAIERKIWGLVGAGGAVTTIAGVLAWFLKG